MPWLAASPFPNASRLSDAADIWRFTPFNRTEPVLPFVRVIARVRRQMKKI
jgi:hypothetical protein